MPQRSNSSSGVRGLDTWACQQCDIARRLLALLSTVLTRLPGSPAPVVSPKETAADSELQAAVSLQPW